MVDSERSMEHQIDEDDPREAFHAVAQLARDEEAFKSALDAFERQDADRFRAVATLNIDEIGGGCANVTTSLTARYTAAHPNLGSIGMEMIGPGGPYGFTLVPDGGAGPGNQFGYATLNTNVADLQSCAYLVKLRAALLLTTGDSIPDDVRDEVAFCKH